MTWEWNKLFDWNKKHQSSYLIALSMKNLKGRLQMSDIRYNYYATTLMHWQYPNKSYKKCKTECVPIPLYVSMEAYQTSLSGELPL